jgi:hypothetical protein
MSAQGFRLRWSKRENDWLFEYNDNAGKSLMGLFFDMLRIEKNIDWIKRRWVNGDYNTNPPVLGGYVEIPEDARDTLIKQLTDRGYDYTTLRITCKKLPAHKLQQS